MMEGGFEPYSELSRQASLDAALLSLTHGDVGSESWPRTACAADCRGYHTGWLLLQSLQIISGLGCEREEMVRDIRRRHAERPISSLMIAGAADFGLLSVVHEALGPTITTTPVTVLDRCQTPLSLAGCTRNAWALRLKAFRPIYGELVNAASIRRGSRSFDSELYCSGPTQGFRRQPGKPSCTGRQADALPEHSPDLGGNGC